MNNMKMICNVAKKYSYSDKPTEAKIVRRTMKLSPFLETFNSGPEAAKDLDCSHQNIYKTNKKFLRELEKSTLYKPQN